MWDKAAVAYYKYLLATAVWTEKISRLAGYRPKVELRLDCVRDATAVQTCSVTERETSREWIHLWNRTTFQHGLRGQFLCVNAAIRLLL
jgi:hypothetical protein